MIQAAGARLWFLPPYSPDLNPIEEAFAKIKHWMRAAQKRSVEEVWRHIGHLTATIEANECNNYFVSALRFRENMNRSRVLMKLSAYRLAGDGDHTISDKMDEVAIKGLHRAEVSNEAPMTITGDQCRAARKLLGWTMSDLSHAVKLSEMDIARFDAGKASMSFIGALLIHRALERAGVEFIAVPPSIKLRNSE